MEAIILVDGNGKLGQLVRAIKDADTLCKNSMTRSDHESAWESAEEIPELACELAEEFQNIMGEPQ